jgi:hypothetical protein
MLLEAPWAWSLPPPVRAMPTTVEVGPEGSSASNWEVCLWLRLLKNSVERIVAA